MAKARDSKPVIHSKKHIARLERERRQTRIIFFSFIGILVVVIGLLAYGYVDLHYLQALRPVAKVGNVSITVAEWEARVRVERTQLINRLALYQQYSQMLGMDLSSQTQPITTELNTPSSLGQAVLDQLINEELVRQEAGKRNLAASTQEVDQAIQSSYQYFPNGSPTPTITPTSVTLPTLSPETLALVTITPTPTAFLTPTFTPTATLGPLVTPTATATLGPTSTPSPTNTPLPTSTPYTLQGFQAQYKQGSDALVQLGMTQAQVRDLYTVNVLRDKLFKIIATSVPLTQDELWARQIVVADLPTATAVRQRLVNGEDFATVAAQVSTDSTSKAKGGDLGWLAKGVEPAEFDQAAFGLKVGEVSQPVKSQDGYHIIQVLAHQNIPLDAAAYSQAQQTAFQNWLTSLRTADHVQTFDIWKNIVPTDPAIPAQLQ